ncbi:uncharacterized protein DUF3231 [Cytobacillus firmus]|uniref:Uncharacterized protein DUF3231 n=2 Tax=Cytobacillus TaxID=2675230 RepID=A0A366K312_CYTFI|nr:MULTISPECIES: DUF3231 family protein [Cytobacillus]RBP96149.1 uncharacterized protein DUF3231 [Cytobacillus firmus]TDX45062.1 uncharacterized protein DUF3231 [Cytobacillus oceanisediminis]
MNYFETLFDTIKPFLDGEKKPLNTLEASNLWLYAGMGQNTLRLEEVWINTVQDNEFKEIITSVFHVHKEIVNDLNEFLLQEGVPLPKPSAPKPIADYQSIPDGARFTEQEIANLLSFNLLIAMTQGMRIITESIRADVGFMVSKFLLKHISVSIPLKQLMLERNWILEAPPYINNFK